MSQLPNWLHFAVLTRLDQLRLAADVISARGREPPRLDRYRSSSTRLFHLRSDGLRDDVRDKAEP